MNTCHTCAHWRPWNPRKVTPSKREGLLQIGQCECPKMIYTCHYDSDGYDHRRMPADGALIEYDESWGMLTGPKFGCVHHEAKS